VVVLRNFGSVLNSLAMLTTRQILVIKLSWSYLSNRLGDFGHIFYKTLFELSPETKALFSNDLEVQKLKFSDMVNRIVVSIQTPENIDEILVNLGESHSGYGVKQHHFDAVSLAFLLSLKKMLKKKFNADTEEAWTMAFNYIAFKMKQYCPQ
jgi:hemoglobin-like flavoprotein